MVTFYSYVSLPEGNTELPVEKTASIEATFQMVVSIRQSAIHLAKHPPASRVEPAVQPLPRLVLVVELWRQGPDQEPMRLAMP